MPGLYEAATRWPFQASTEPGLSVSGDHRGCNALTGRFVVHLVEYGPGGLLDRFQAAFEQHCEGGVPALVGDITYVRPPAALPDPTPSPVESSLSFDSDPGDFIGAGQSWAYSAGTAAFEDDHPFGSNAIRVQVTPIGSPFVLWTLVFQAAGDAPLVPAFYTHATRWPFNGGAVGFSLGGDGRGCNTLTATFAVHEVVYAPGGELDRFQATFEQHCEDAAPAARGEIVYIRD